MAESRSTNFSQGFQSAKRGPSTIQSGIAGGYRPKSVLDNLRPSGTGLAESDRSRLLAGGGMLPSSNGSSESTYQRSSWLTSPYRPLG